MDSLLSFYAAAAKLKRLPRAGWQRCGIGDSESVAEHTFGVALLALLMPAPTPGFNREHCAALAMVHDLAESLIGDITPHDGVEPADKLRREQHAIAQLADQLGDKRLVELWNEFETGATEEAQMARDLDVIEMAWQAIDYRSRGLLTTEQTETFLNSARRRIHSAAGQKLLQSLS